MCGVVCICKCMTCLACLHVGVDAYIHVGGDACVHV